ncbi:SPOR domain-containing protein [Christensenellaceae bacterium OttesenSCG-928-M15]|nr:SPOR domain-containing protein [Christensenellaceae bacterium OttesenSCG-928-M15]
MEYRRRKRRRSVRAGNRNVSAGGAGAKVAVVLLLAAVVVYLISASALGTWIAQNVFAPVFEKIDGWFSAPAPTPGATLLPEGSPSITMNPANSDMPANAQTVTNDIDFPSMECYAVQMGVFSDRNNAEQQAQTLMQRGAGGYIMEDGGRYRVLAAAYSSEESLRQVRSQLENDGMESASYTFLAQGSTLRITAYEAQLSAIQNGFLALKGIQQDVLSVSLAFDQEQQAPAAGRERAGGLLKELRDAKATFEETAGTDNGVLRAVSECFSAYEEALQALNAYQSENFVDFSSKIKYTNISMMHSYYVLSEKIMELA